MDHQSTIETAILLGNQMDVNASATCAAESFITMGPFMTYSSHTQQPQTCTNSEEQQQKHNTMYHQQPIASTARSGNEMDILQAALHLADISEEELKAEELNTSLFPTQELQQDQGGGRGISSYTSLAQLQSTGLCMDPEYQCASSIYTNQSQPHLIPCQSSSIQQPGIVMTSQVQPQNSAVFAANAPSVAKKRKGSNSTGSSCSPNEGLPRPRGRPKSPKGAPKNTPKKKPQPFISTYNGQKVMYIPVPCPNNGETPVAPSSAMPPIITQNIPPFLSQSTVQLTPDQQPNTQPNISAKCQPVKVPTIKSKKTTCTKAQQKKLGIQLKQSMNIAVSKHNQGQLGTTNFIQPNSYIQSSVCSIEQSSVNSRNCPVVIAGSNAAKSQVIEFASSSSSLPADNSNSSDQPIKVQIMSQSNQQPTRIIQQHHQSISSRSANGMDPKLANGSMVNSQPVHVSTSGQNGIRLAPHQVSASNQTMQKLNIIASSIQPQSKGYQQTSRCQDQQPMITFQIVQNSKTGTIEFIPVGPSNGKTQIQIIPKPAQIQQHAIRVTTEAAETPKPFVTGLNNHVEGTAMKSIAMKVQDASLVQSSPKSMSKKKSAKSNAALQFPRKRGRPRNQPSNESKDAVDKISAALKSIGATVCPVGSLGSTHLVPKLCPGAELPPGNSSTMSIQSPCSSSQMTLHDSELSNFSNGEGAKDHLKKESPKALKKACDSGGASKKKSTKDSRSHSSQAVPPHVQGAINYEQNRVLAPDFSRCFERMRDATMRLLPYHVLQDLAFNEVFLEKEDVEFEKHCASLLVKADNLFLRFKCAMLKDCMRDAPNSDYALLERLQHQCAIDKLDEAKKECTNLKALKKQLCSKNIYQSTTSQPLSISNTDVSSEQICQPVMTFQNGFPESQKVAQSARYCPINATNSGASPQISPKYQIDERFSENTFGDYPVTINSTDRIISSEVDDKLKNESMSQSITSHSDVVKDISICGLENSQMSSDTKPMQFDSNFAANFIPNGTHEVQNGQYHQYVFTEPDIPITPLTNEECFFKCSSKSTDSGCFSQSECDQAVNSIL